MGTFLGGEDEIGHNKRGVRKHSNMMSAAGGGGGKAVTPKANKSSDKLCECDSD